MVLAGFSLTAPSTSRFPELPQFALQKLKLEAIERGYAGWGGTRRQILPFVLPPHSFLQVPTPALPMTSAPEQLTYRLTRAK